METAGSKLGHSAVESKVSLVCSAPGSACKEITEESVGNLCFENIQLWITAIALEHQ